MKLLRRLHDFFQRRRVEADMAEEMRLHLEQRAEEYRAAGLPPDEARYAALRKFGGVEQVKERARDARHCVWAEHLWRDVRHAFRALRQRPMFAFVAIASLAIAVGANTAVFGLMETMLLRPLPVRHPHELFLLGWERTANKGAPSKGDGGDVERGEIDPANGQPITRIFSLPAFERLQAAAAPAELVAMAQLWQPNLTVDGVAERIGVGQLVSGNYHLSLGLTAVAGRLLQPSDDRSGAPPVIVISHRYWEQRFARSESVVGKQVWLNRAPVTIVGVAPPAFIGTTLAGGPADIFAPLALTPQVYPEADEMPMNDPGVWWLRIMGRVAGGATIEQSRASLEGAFLEMARGGWSTPEAPPRLIASPAAYGWSEANRRNVALGMSPLVGMGALLLLAACANLANLLLARGVARRRELAVRLALGAGRGRIVRQLLSESVLLAALGAAAGLLVAAWTTELVRSVVPRSDAPDLFTLQIDWRVAGFAAALTLLTALLFGLVPAWRATRLDLTTEFQGGPRSLGGARSRLSQVLLVCQVAFSLVLLVMAGLLGRTVQNLRTVEIGFNPERLLLFSLEGVPAGYAEGTKLEAFYRDAAERIRALPGVRSATYSRTPILSRHGNSRLPFGILGAPAAVGERPEVEWNQVEAGFFSTYEMRVLLGREFTPQDRAGAPKVVVVNRSLAEKFFRDENPVGRHVQLGSRRGPGEVEIVGVVHDFPPQDLRRAASPAAYSPVAQSPVREAHFAVRTSARPESATAAIRAAVSALDPNVPLANVRTQAEQIEWSVAEEKLFARLAWFIGVASLALACVGLCGLMAYGVARRTGEIGLRIALGALPRQVVALMVRESFRLVIVGVALGIAGAAAAARLLTRMLYGLSPTDPATYAVVTLVLVAVALLAVLLPARRAAKVDPMVALRCE